MQGDQRLSAEKLYAELQRDERRSRKISIIQTVILALMVISSLVVLYLMV